MTDAQLKVKYGEIKGKTIAIVYVFEGDKVKGFDHFYIWKSKIIAKWLEAVQDLHCLPLILDVRTFIEKAIGNTLPHIDYVLNLNSGTINLSSMALIPSVCSSINVPCIPGDAVSIVTGESKHLSNLIAQSVGLRIPKYLDKNDKNGIFRPNNMGNSLGVRRGAPQNECEGLYQDFIPGFDITTPLVFNPSSESMELLPTIAFIPDNNCPNWFFGEAEKINREGFQMKTLRVCDEVRFKYLEFAKSLSVQTFCRIDARLKCSNSEEIMRKLREPLLFQDIYFIEINVMPTIRENNSFMLSYNETHDENQLHQSIKCLFNVFRTNSLHCFLLANSILAYSRSTY